jgi:cytochrome c oxidase assembly factor CtaG
VSAHLLHMASMGLLVSVVAPALAVAAARVPALDRLAVPAVLALPGFTVLHAALTLTIDAPGAEVGPASLTGAHLVLLVGAVLFWMPVLGVRRRLPDAGRMVYLFLAGPLLDLAGVWLVAQGDTAGGLAMIVGMLPIGIAAIAVAWRWMLREERAAAVART